MMDNFTLMAMVDRAIGSAILSAGRPDEETFKAQFASDREAVIRAVAELGRLRTTLHGIAETNYRSWDVGLNNAEEFVRWAQSRANWAIRAGEATGEQT